MAVLRWEEGSNCGLWAALCVSGLPREVKGTLPRGWKGLLVWVHTHGLYIETMNRSGTRVGTPGEMRSVFARDLRAEAELLNSW